MKQQDVVTAISPNIQILHYFNSTPKIISKILYGFNSLPEEVKEKEAEWLDEFYPSRVNKEDRKSADTKTESAKMPVTPKEKLLNKETEIQMYRAGTFAVI